MTIGLLFMFNFNNYRFIIAVYDIDDYRFIISKTIGLLYQ